MIVKIVLNGIKKNRFFLELINENDNAENIIN